MRLSFRDFGWDEAAFAALDHPTLPWWKGESSGRSRPSAGVTLDALAHATARVRLSLLGQFAAHQAFLRQADIGDGPFRADHWLVFSKRGEDPHLVRVRAHPICPHDAETTALGSIARLAELLDVQNLDVLRQAWAKPESVYAEIDRLLETAPQISRRWFRRAALGAIYPPGNHELREAFHRACRIRLGDPFQLSAMARRLRTFGSENVLILGEEASPLETWSAVRSISSIIGELATEWRAGEVAEILFRRLGEKRLLLIALNTDSYDRRSAELLQILLSERDRYSWLLLDESAAADGATLSPSHWFVISRLLAPRRALDSCLTSLGPRAEETLRSWVESDSYGRFLHLGTLPEADWIVGPTIPEPRRSFLAALSLLGRRVPRSTASRFLLRLGSSASLEELREDGLVELDNEWLTFNSEQVVQLLSGSIPKSSRRGLFLLAAELLENESPVRSARLLASAGDHERARRILDRSLVDQLVVADDFPLTGFEESLILGSPPLAALQAEALIKAGRYRSALPYADAAGDDCARVLRAMSERRLGNYAHALSLLEELDGRARSFESEILRGEILRLSGDCDDAALAFETACGMADTKARRVRLGYERAMLALEIEQEVDAGWRELDRQGYWSARLEAYELLSRGLFGSAMTAAERAVAQAPDVPARIDAMLDLFYAAFEGGEWNEARHRGRALLASIEETEGDRAAGGVLFTLAYLCADDGQFDQAREKIGRLRAFYAANEDPRRLRELALLDAHLALGEGELDLARASALTLLDPAVSAEIRQAAGLVVDEVDWVRGELTELHSTFTGSAELRSRHLLASARLEGKPSRKDEGSFNAALARWERSWLEHRPSETPKTASRSEQLRLMRSAAGLSRNVESEELVALCDRLGAELGVSLGRSPRHSHAVELKALQQAASAAFPFRESDLAGLSWRFASRNRLGRWSQHGTVPPMDEQKLDELLSSPVEDCVSVGDQSLLWIENLDEWSSASRQAIAELFRVRSENYYLRRAVEAASETTIAERPEELIEGLVGCSPQIRDVASRIRRFASRDLPVCILGESGTGKELVARALHRVSSRRRNPFTALNCAALPEPLVESQLFGHVRGAFTGAERDRVGLIEATDGGTLFLDEVGELALPVQAKLLRFLQEREFRPVGETSNRHADVRILAATNRELEKAVDEGMFREDLFYRITVLELTIPPLRERGADVLLLARHFLAAERERQRGGAEVLSDEVELVLGSYRWPGNVRELQNTIRAAHALAADRKVIELEHLPDRLRGATVRERQVGSYFDELLHFRRSLIERSLVQSKGNQNQAARLLGMSRQALAYQIRELGIEVR